MEGSGFVADVPHKFRTCRISAVKIRSDWERGPTKANEGRRLRHYFRRRVIQRPNKRNDRGSLGGKVRINLVPFLVDPINTLRYPFSPRDRFLS